jgi:hypothetical protein
LKDGYPKLTLFKIWVPFCKSNKRSRVISEVLSNNASLSCDFSLNISCVCRAVVTIGLNALYGREKHDKRMFWVGDWDPSNTQALMNYTILKGYHIDSWEFGK